MDIPSRDRQVLTSWVRSTSVRAELAQRARIVLLAADGAGTSEIVARTGASKPTVVTWKKRYAVEGLGGLRDRRKPGRPRIDDAAIVLATLEPPPEWLGVQHWSSRLLATELGVSNVKVATTWREFGLQPWRHAPFRFSADPELEVTAREVTALYLNPPDYAVVLCEAEEPHGAATVLAALQAAAGEAVTRPSFPNRRHEWFLRFLQQAAAARLGDELHVIAVDSYATRRHPDVRTWLSRHPRITPHFVTARRSWLTMTEVFAALSTRQAISRDGVAAADLGAAISGFIAGWSDCGQPFSWTKPADEYSARRTSSGEVSRASLAGLP